MESMLHELQLAHDASTNDLRRDIAALKDALNTMTELKAAADAELAKALISEEQ
jgi:hypothetical protein